MFNKNFRLAGVVALAAATVPAFAFARTITLPVAAGQAQVRVQAAVQLPQVPQGQVNVGGNVTAITGTAFTLAASDGTAYSVDASAAKVFRRYGYPAVESDIQIGDQVQVTGTMASADATTGATLTASVIRDQSIQELNGTFTGKVASLGDNTFAMQTYNNGLETIYLTDSTVITINGQPGGSFSDLAPGSYVFVQGVWNRSGEPVAANRNNIKTPAATPATSTQP